MSCAPLLSQSQLTPPPLPAAFWSGPAAAHLSGRAAGPCPRSLGEEGPSMAAALLTPERWRLRAVDVPTSSQACIQPGGGVALRLASCPTQNKPRRSGFLRRREVHAASERARLPPSAHWHSRLAPSATGRGLAAPCCAAFFSPWGVGCRMGPPCKCAEWSAGAGGASADIRRSLSPAERASLRSLRLGSSTGERTGAKKKCSSHEPSRAVPGQGLSSHRQVEFEASPEPSTPSFVPVELRCLGPTCRYSSPLEHVPCLCATASRPSPGVLLCSRCYPVYTQSSLLEPGGLL